MNDIISCKDILENIDNLELERQVSIISDIENQLKPYVFRSFSYEEERGNSFISWLKRGNPKEGLKVISSTFGTTDTTFCDSMIGIKYSVPQNGFIAACEKDAATIIEPSFKASIYTVKELEGDMVINSYNFATPIITPMQLFNYDENTYMSKHNEIILDPKVIKPIAIVCLDDSYSEMALRLSNQYGVSVEEKNKKL